jgi:Flp pilus assembly protein TadB
MELTQVTRGGYMEVQTIQSVFLFLSVGAVSLFSFIAVVGWSQARSSERKAYYKYEMFKKLGETEGPAAASVLELLREQEKNAQVRQREKAKLSGLITVAGGVALIVFLRQFLLHSPVYLCGLIPLFIGAAQLAYVYLLAPKL